MTKSTLLERLVSLANQTYEPDRARRSGGRALFDYLTCMHAGQPMVAAGVGDAGAAAALDRDDLHWPSVTHPGAIIWTTLRSAGAEAPILWQAAHAGYEVTGRLALALGGEHRRHWHATTTAGTVGGAVAAALAIGRDPVSAAAHAVSVAGGSIVPILERTSTRQLHRDHAAATAERCARLAELSAARDCLEHPRGMFAAMGGDPDLLLASATDTVLDQISFRRHATSGFSQALVEAAAELAPLDAHEPVLAQAPAETLALASNPAPRDAEEAWWSAQHAVAVTLLGLDLEDGSLVTDRRVAALRDQVRLQLGTCSRVTIGERSAERDRAAPLEDRDLIAKWRGLLPHMRPPVELLD